MTTYAWKIDSTSADTNTMQVTYTFDGKSTALNLQVPALGVDVAEWIDKFAPRSLWELVPTDAIIVGSEGLGLVEVAAATPSPAPAPSAGQNAALNEEYLRALIYQVLEEIRVAAL